MNQRKFNWTYLLLMAVFVLASCSKVPKSAKFIPADAAVVSIDVKQMFEKSKVSDNEEAKNKLLETIEQNAKNQETKDLIKKIVEDPAKAGVDLREPIFAFVTKEQKSGATGTLLDKDDFAQLLNTVAKEGGLEATQEKDGIQYIQNKRDIIAFDDANFFYTESYSLDEVVALFKNDDTQNTMAENDDFGKFSEGKGFIKALIPMVAFEELVNEKAKQSLPEGAELKDLSLFLDLTSDKGVAKLSAETLAKSDAWKKAIKQSTDICGTIDGDYLKYIAKGAFVMYANFDGKKLYELLEKNDALKNIGADSQKELAKKVLESIDGDFVIGVSEVKGLMPEAAIYINTKDQSILDLAKQNGLKPEKGIDFGFKDGTTYLAIGEKGAFTEAKEGYDKGNVKGRRFYLACDIELISNLASMINRTASSSAKMAADHISAAEWYDTSDTSCELVLKMKDQEKDPLQYFLDLFLKQIM
ncbi:MAG: DUF4836 family protein [Prevotella sp.]|nr:DUF4836 family protein [Prevotella sp.]